MANLSLEQVADLAKTFRVIPLVEKVAINEETPLTIFQKIAGDRPGAFLLESAAQGVWSRYSFIGVSSRGELVKYPDGETKWLSAKGHSAFPFAEHPDLASSGLDAIAQIVDAWKTPHMPDLPPLTSGLVGAMGWDLIREIENLPNPPKSDFYAPLICLSMVEDLVIVDHLEGQILFVANIFNADTVELVNAYSEAIDRIQLLIAGLDKPLGSHRSQETEASREIRNRISKEQFFDSLEKAKHYVRIGDVFQVVISQRFDIDIAASPLDVYRELRALNPSPYMYLLNFEDDRGAFAVVGSSPEALVTVTGENAVMHPIAGSRPRGTSEIEDSDFAHSLINDEKERAEHLMLVDLVRNDLSKACDSNSVRVTEFMQIHKYSHIMHLVSTVTGKLRLGKNAIDVFKATFPAGTLSGAPKPRALEIIDELEPAGRGIYGGVVGYFDFAGNADLAIAIRTAFIRDGIARIQAGAGIVLDSVLETEYQETVNKAGAPMRAIRNLHAN